jgi:hypothetical protein
MRGWTPVAPGLNPHWTHFGFVDEKSAYQVTTLRLFIFNFTWCLTLSFGQLKHLSLPLQIEGYDPQSTELVKDTRAKTTGIRSGPWNAWIGSFLWTWIFSSNSVLAL